MNKPPKEDYAIELAKLILEEVEAHEKRRLREMEIYLLRPQKKKKKY